MDILQSMPIGIRIYIFIYIAMAITIWVYRAFRYGQTIVMHSMQSWYLNVSVDAYVRVCVCVCRGW